ncbi:hypothetical protein [Endozoicomonas montiporae]|nr:hypothetical protein [Endozoicomonas montiporae]
MNDVFTVYKHRAGYLAVEKICGFPLQKRLHHKHSILCQALIT